MKKLVVMLAFKGDKPYDPYVERCAYSWNFWCNKHGHDFIFWDEAIEDMRQTPATFQRMRIFDVLDKNGMTHEEVSLVDYDTFIFPWTDDYFKLTNGKFSGVPDAGFAPQINRSIQMVKENWFPNSKVNWGNYINAGFFTFTREHRKALEAVYSFYKTEQEKWKKANNSPDMTDDQTPLNFIIREHGFDINLLPRDYNVLDNYLFSMFTDKTDELGRRIDRIKTIRTAAKITHLTSNPQFRNDATQFFFEAYKKELELDGSRSIVL